MQSKKVNDKFRLMRVSDSINSAMADIRQTLDEIEATMELYKRSPVLWDKYMFIMEINSLERKITRQLNTLIGALTVKMQFLTTLPKRPNIKHQMHDIAVLIKHYTDMQVAYSQSEKVVPGVQKNTPMGENVCDTFQAGRMREMYLNKRNQH